MSDVSLLLGPKLIIKTKNVYEDELRERVILDELKRLDVVNHYVKFFNE